MGDYSELITALRHYAILKKWGGATRGIRETMVEAARAIEKLQRALPPVEPATGE